MSDPKRKGLVVRTISSLLGATLIVLVFSEYIFVNEGPALAIAPPNPISLRVASLASMASFYFFMLLVWAAAMSWFRPTRLSAVFLVACIGGWAIEGMIIPAVHEAPSISIIWTSVAWHGFIDFLFGLYVLCWALGRGWVAALVTCAVTGALWGYWATWPPVDEVPWSPEDFAVFTALSGTALIIGFALWRVGGGTIMLPRWASFVIAALALPLFVLQGFSVPFSLAMLGVAMGATLLSLSIGRDGMALPWLPRADFPLLRLLALPLVPVVAALVFALCRDQGIAVPTEEVTGIFLVLGALALVVAIIRVALRSRPLWPTPSMR